MSETCDGRHVCEPTHWPTGLGESWTCGECGRVHRSYRVHDDPGPLTPSMLATIPEGTHGWTTRDAPRPAVPARGADPSELAAFRESIARSWSIAAAAIRGEASP